MPKRSNDFQHLIFLIKQQLAEDSVVTESKMPVDRVTGSKREVDICIETAIAGHNVILCIECRDHKRINDVTWVEQMKSKHDRLPTNILVLATQSGFTPEAQKVAEAHGIETIVMEKMNEDEAKDLFGENGALWSKTYELTPAKVKITVYATENLSSETVVALNDTAVYNGNGDYLGPVQDLVMFFLETEAVGQELFNIGKQEHKFFELGWEDPIDGNGKPVYLHKLDPPLLRQIKLVYVTGTCKINVSDIKLRHAKMQNLKIAWGKGNVKGKEFMIVASEDENGVRRVTAKPKQA